LGAFFFFAAFFLVAAFFFAAFFFGAADGAVGVAMVIMSAIFGSPV
jgi:hypothetical protein